MFAHILLLSTSAVPLYQTATFAQDEISASSSQQYDYTRSGNPTRTALEQQLAAIEHVASAESDASVTTAHTFTSGMSAVATVCSLLTSSTDVILASDDVYGGTTRLLSAVVQHSVVYVDTCDLAAVEKALISNSNIRMLIFESPSNPTMRVCDIRAVCALAHLHHPQCIVVVDTSLLSPWLLKPLALGADIALHSATKFISGHSDVTAGVLCTNKAALTARIKFLQNAQGTALAPFDCWLLLRGIKTMHVRMKQQQAAAQQLALWLSSAECKHIVSAVMHVGLPLHPGHQLHQQQSTGAGSVFSVVLHTEQQALLFVNSTKLFKRTVSFGSVTSSIQLPSLMSHASVPALQRAQLRFNSCLVRISVGLEAEEDLIADLRQALAVAFSSKTLEQ